MENFFKYDERQVQIFNSVHELRAAGYSNRKIANLIGISRTTVVKYVHGDFDAICQKEFRSGMHVYHNYIVKSLQSGMSRKDIFRSVRSKGYQGKQTAAYDYMNRVVDFYSIDISLYKSASAETIRRRKELQKYDYLTRAEIFKFLWMNKEIPQAHKEYAFSKYPQLYELSICVKEFRQIFCEKRMPHGDTDRIEPSAR